MTRKNRKTHRESDSALFRMRSKSRLAKLLQIDVQSLKNLAYNPDLYSEFYLTKSDGGSRPINAPSARLKSVQSRLTYLLQSIATPDYLYAPALRRSYVDNAACHLGSATIQAFDIVNYFPSCKENRVIWFFHRRMKCSPDVAAILRGIVTHKGSLPQGSPCSPILAYLCYQDMWNEIYEIAKQYNCRMSLYVDDLTISGESVPRRLAWEVETILHRHGHKSNQGKKHRRYMRPMEVTGVIVDRDRLIVPNRQHKRLVEVRSELKKSTCPDEQRRLKQQLRGRLAQFGQVAKKSDLSQLPKS